MLVLSRRRGQQIVIDGKIVVTVVEVRGDKVRLGIDAPAEVAVHRSEVHDAILRKQQAEQEQTRQDSLPAPESARR